MASIERLREVMLRLGRVKPDDDRILQLGRKQLGYLVRKACKAAGLRGKFGTNSMRIGMAQELAVAGFSLEAITHAGRWASSRIPAYHINQLKALE